MNARIDAQGRFTGPEQPPHRSAWVWVPTEQVLLLRVEVPGRRWRRALPFAVEPWLAAPLEEQAVMPLHRARSGETWCVVVARRLLEQWRAALPPAWQAQPLVPDCFEVAPVEPGRWAVLEREGRVQVRQDAWRGFAAPSTWLPALAEAAGVETVSAQPAPALTAKEARQLNINRQRGGPVLLAPTALRPLRRVGLLMLALLGVWLGHVVWQTHRLQHQAQAYEQAALSAFQHAFPSVHRVVNVRVQAQNAVRRWQAQRQSWWPLARLVESVETAGGRIEALTLDANGWRMQVRLPPGADADRLAARLKGRVVRRQAVGKMVRVTYAGSA